MICPKCGNTWGFRKLPLFILTGCSGVGKTTTAKEIIRRDLDFVVLDADMFHSIMSPETEEDYYEQVEQIGSLSKNIMQSGMPVLWTMAGNLDKVKKTYNSRFFKDIYCLALVCREDLLRTRMREGRGIEDENWIQGSVDYNAYFCSHTELDDMQYEVLDISDRDTKDIADEVIRWVREKMSR